ncbi:hypothetical protein Q5425_18830 [Amycolatopsis sp. A133]|uniref:hypothetical protein n=1 Tax=Amycolatopsis sp. A133 TaxID=3064472 RepID=UPI0027EEED23|nr:hypothetical protein [Amycolatopsis sp. A133]MDQ7805805.1 hypothetical protein [Amycolatopsis sp. A133]
MAVRVNSLFRREDENHRGRKGIGNELRNRFGFSLIQAPLRKTTTWATDQDLPLRRHSDGVRTTRPLEAAIDLAPLMRGRIGSRA